MNNLFKVAALGLALTAGLTSCEKKAETTTETTNMEAPATPETTTVATDSTSTMAPATPAAEGAMAPAAGETKMESTTTTTEEKK